jgi:hypothetical protein
MRESEASEVTMRVVRSLLGVAIMLAVLAFGSRFLHLTNDLALRLMLVFVLLALAGVASALIWFNRRDSSD